MSSYASTGRPVDLGYQRLATIEHIDDVELVEDRLNDGPWYVQIGPGDVRVLSADQIRACHQQGTVSGRTYVWQQGMQQWLPLSTFIDEAAAPPASSVHSEIPTQPRASTRPLPFSQPLKAASTAQSLASVQRLASAQPAAHTTSGAAQSRGWTAPQATAVQRTPSIAPATGAARPAPQQLVAPVLTAPAKAPAPARPPQSPTSISTTQLKATAAPPSDEDETWSVLMGPGEVRTLSLEQLDDFFRLEVIDEQTYVWQKGMANWAPLSEILGPEPEEEECDTWYAQIAPGEIKTLTLEQLDDFYRLDIIDERTPIWQPGMAQWFPLGMLAGIESTAPGTTPMQSTTTWAPQPVVAQAPKAAAVFVSDAPLALSIPVPEAPAERRSWTLRLAVAAGVLLTLLRNDVIFAGAEAASQGSYVQAEQRVLGGPIFGTTRSVDALIAQSGGRLKPVRLPWLVTEMQEKKSQAAALAASNAAAAKPEAAAKTDKLAAAGTKVDTATPAAAKTIAKPEHGGEIAAALSGAAPAKPKFGAAKPAAAPKAARKKGSRSGGGPFTGKGDYYDPLNGSM